MSRFHEYATVILRSIDSCDNEVQLGCCWDLIDHFYRLFMRLTPHAELCRVTDEMHRRYIAKQSSLMVA